MFELFEKVKIKTSNEIGVIVDIDNDGLITVECERYVNTSGKQYSGDYPLYYCTSDELEKVNEKKKIKKAVALF